MEDDDEGFAGEVTRVDATAFVEAIQELTDETPTRPTVGACGFCGRERVPEGGPCPNEACGLIPAEGRVTCLGCRGTALHLVALARFVPCDFAEAKRWAQASDARGVRRAICISSPRWWACVVHEILRV